MFGKQSEKPDVKVFVGPSAAASVHGRMLRWLVKLDGGEWSKDVALPKEVGPADIAVLHPDRMGMTLVTTGGEMWGWDFQSLRWTCRGNAMEPTS